MRNPEAQLSRLHLMWLVLATAAIAGLLLLVWHEQDQYVYQRGLETRIVALESREAERIKQEEVRFTELQGLQEQQRRDHATLYRRTTVNFNKATRNEEFLQTLGETVIELLTALENAALPDQR